MSDTPTLICDGCDTPLIPLCPYCDTRPSREMIERGAESYAAWRYETGMRPSLKVLPKDRQIAQRVLRAALEVSDV